MECPFRTITVTEEFSAKKGSVVSTEFAECLKHDCPFYGKDIQRHRAAGGFETVKMPICRRADNG